MTQKEFDNVLQRYLDGVAGKDEKELIEEWYERINVRDAAHLSAKDFTALREIIWEKINHPPHIGQPTKWHLSWAKVAAAIFFLFTGSLFFVKSNLSSKESISFSQDKNLTHFDKVENKSNSDRFVCLSDGSSVVLKPGGVIRCPPKFGDERHVYLKGVAFFEVFKDAAHPFIVHTGDVVTKVLGTSFLIEENHCSKTVEVSVKTGKVMVYAENLVKRNVSDRSLGFILKPNQKVVYDESSETLVKKLVDEPVVLNNSLLLKLKYDNKPVPDIFNALEKIYGIHFEYNAEDLAGCTLTTELTEENLYQRIEIICRALGLEYAIGSEAVEIKGKCK